jgi:hypothetical protein
MYGTAEKILITQKVFKIDLGFLYERKEHKNLTCQKASKDSNYDRT